LDRPRPGIDWPSLHIGHLQRPVGNDRDDDTQTLRCLSNRSRCSGAATLLARAFLPRPLEADAGSGSLDARRRSDARHGLVDPRRDLWQLKAEAEREIYLACVGEMQCAGTFVASEPPELEEAGQQRSSDPS